LEILPVKGLIISPQLDAAVVASILVVKPTDDAPLHLRLCRVSVEFLPEV